MKCVESHFSNSGLGKHSPINEQHKGIGSIKSAKAKTTIGRKVKVPKQNASFSLGPQAQGGYIYDAVTQPLSVDKEGPRPATTTRDLSLFCLGCSSPPLLLFTYQFFMVHK